VFSDTAGTLVLLCAEANVAVRHC